MCSWLDMEGWLSSEAASCGLGSRHEVLREISFLSRGPDINSEHSVCGAEAGAHGTPARLGTVLGACVLAAH